MPLLRMTIFVIPTTAGSQPVAATAAWTSAAAEMTDQPASLHFPAQDIGYLSGNGFGRKGFGNYAGGGGGGNVHRRKATTIIGLYFCGEQNNWDGLGGGDAIGSVSNT